VHICTVITRNYAARARVLARSQAAVHPESTTTVLVVDDPDGRIDPAVEPFEVLRPEDLEIKHFERRTGYYSPAELSTSLKAALLSHVARKRGVAAFVDADIEIFGSLSGLEERAREHGIVYTPHSLSPLPNDSLVGNQGAILTVGAANSGFVVVSDAEEPLRILDWWDAWLLTECKVSILYGRYYDQTWLDLVPGFAESFHVERDPGCNVAYWNLPERDLAGSEGAWTVNGEPLRFFHFSGFNPHLPGQLRDGGDGEDRIVDPGPELRELLAGHARRLLENGWESALEMPYGFAALPGGLRLDQRARDRYARALQENEMGDESLFTASGEARLAELLAADRKQNPAAGLKARLFSRRS
jgi:hypothetical protein